MTEDAPATAVRGRRGWRRGVVLTIVLVGVAVLLGGGAAAWHASSSPQFCNSCHIMRPYVAAWHASRHSEVACVQCHYPPGLKDTLRVKFQAVTQVAKWATGTYNSKPYAEVEDASCLRSGCHASGALIAKAALRFGRGIRFDHGPHLDSATMGRALRCTACHTQIVVGKHFEVDRRPCFTCHFKGTKNGRELTPVAGCLGCHETPKGSIPLGVVRLDHEEMVRRGVACQNCHLNVVDGRGEAPPERCVTCHNQAEKVARYPQTALIHAAHVTERSIECTRCHSEIKHRLPPRLAGLGAAPGATRGTAVEDSERR
jgi:nitrate/TMAO reductase-like tetraheme cytochrome c subunit